MTTFPNYRDLLRNLCARLDWAISFLKALKPTGEMRPDGKVFLLDYETAGWDTADEWLPLARLQLKEAEEVLDAGNRVQVDPTLFPALVCNIAGRVVRFRKLMATLKGNVDSGWKDSKVPMHEIEVLFAEFGAALPFEKELLSGDLQQVLAAMRTPPSEEEQQREIDHLQSIVDSQVQLAEYWMRAAQGWSNRPFLWLTVGGVVGYHVITWLQQLFFHGH